MPNIKITELIQQLALSSDDVMPFVDVDDLAQGASGSTRKVTLQGIIDFLVNNGFLIQGDNISLLNNDVPYLTTVALNDVSDVTLTGVAQGDILYYNGSEWVNLGAGTNGYYLRTNGTGANPTWEEVVIAYENKAYVQTSTEGLGNITLSGEQTLNGITTSSSRVIVLEQTLGQENGIYVTGAGAWTRATDLDEDNEIITGVTTYVSDSNSEVYGNKYLLITNDPIIIGTTPQVWEVLPAPQGGEPDPTNIVYTYDGSDRVATQTITNDSGNIITTYTYKTDGSNRVDFYTINKYGVTTTHTPTYTPTDSNKITQIVIT